MGHGGSLEDAGRTVGQSGDGGIDGIIKEDKLGLDNIYIQAKRWDGSVGRPIVQGFAGSLEGQRARKGVLITTSVFTQDAKQYVEAARAAGASHVRIMLRHIFPKLISGGLRVPDAKWSIGRHV